MATQLTSMMRWVGGRLPERWKRHLKMMLGVPTIEASLVKLKHNNFRPQVVIDVGAYVGDWTRLCKQIFPAAHVLMIEPQASRQGDLERVMAEHVDVALAPVLVGAAAQDDVGFYDIDSASSVLPAAVEPRLPSVYLPMTTLDAVTEHTPFAHADLIKLDVQGYELHVLQGGAQTLASAEAVVMEVNVIEIYQGAPLFHEAVGFMADRGYQVYDICTFFRRPYDGALWQVDVIFVKSSSGLVSCKRWS